MRRVTKAIELARTQSNPNRRNCKRRSERVLVAVKLTEEGGELVTWALTHCSQSGDVVTIIHVVEPCSSLATRIQVLKWEKQKNDMLNTLSELGTYCRKHYDVPDDLSIIVEVVESTSIGDTIVEEARNLEATRVIIGKHKSRRLDISPKRMTDLGRLCVQNLEPYCEVVIVRKGKVLMRKRGLAKFRRSLQTLLLSNKPQKSNKEPGEFEEADNGRQLVVGKFSQLGSDESGFGPKESSERRFSSSAKSSSLSSVPLSDSLNGKSTANSSQDSSCSSGTSSGGSENSPNSVLRILNRNGKSSFSGEKIDGGFICFASLDSRTTPSSTPLSFQDGTGSAPSSRSRSPSHCLEPVPELPELPAKAEDCQRDQNEGALVVYSQPQLEDGKDDPEGQFAIVCLNLSELEERKDGEEFGALYHHPSESEDRKEEAGRGQEGAMALAGFSPLGLEDRSDEEGEGEGEKGALVCLSAFPPPQFAQTCSASTYNLSEDGLQSLSTDVKVELPEVERFSYEELRAAADDFAPGNVIGTGGASSVYKAQLSDGRQVALKRLVDSMAGEKEFMMEMMMLICTLNHPNLVTMIGFCAERSHRLIAYQLLTRGSLEQNLHSVTNSRKLNWVQRHKVAFGASRGLAYLHSFSPNPIIHRDIKTSNILLADDFEAQISDFGLARWLSDAGTIDEQVSCAGTFGYLAPESLMYGDFNERTDVFAFGVVLLELISGRRPMAERLPESQQSLVLWARTLQQNGRTHDLVDRSLKDINPQQFKRMMYTAFLCVQVSPEDRPTIDRVVRLLDPTCYYSPAILQPNISAPSFPSMPTLNGSRP